MIEIHERWVHHANPPYPLFMLNICLVAGHGLTTMRAGLIVPEVRDAARSAAPAFCLFGKPGRQPNQLDPLHVLHHTQPIRILWVVEEMDHQLAGFHLGAFNAELIPLTLSTGFDRTGGAVPGGTFAFATVAGLFSGSCFGLEHHGTSPTIQSAITIKSIFHRFSYTCLYLLSFSIEKWICTIIRSFLDYDIVYRKRPPVGRFWFCHVKIPYRLS